MPNNTFPVNGGAMPALPEQLVLQRETRIHSIQTLFRLRREARDEISRLIQFLDASDEYVMTELEEDNELEETGDSEPSLGSFDLMINQEKSYRGGAYEVDAELDIADDEPNLGASEHYHPSNQSFWAFGSSDDREDDAGDNPEHDEAEGGIADEDGLREQYGFKVL
jgi:hypothetical protein